MAFDSMLRRLVDKERILPFFELGMLADNWPDHYNVPVDSSPYYGLDEEGEPDGYFHPSTHCLMGLRELYLAFHPDTKGKMVKPRRTFKQQMTFAMGTALHAVVQTQMEIMGLVRQENIEYEYTLEDHNVRGRLDFIFDHPTDGEILVELKTRGSWLFKNDIEIQPSWDAQLSMAEYALGRDGGIVLVLERGDQCGMREFAHRRNDLLLEQTFEKFAYVRECIANNTPPEHCCMPDSSTMQKCQARYECWLKKV